MGTTMSKRIRARGNFCRLFFVKPRVGMDARALAERYAAMSNVEEVMITEDGYIIKTKESGIRLDRKDALLERRSYKKIESYYQYCSR